ncbi:MAG TPA: TorF family putative porin [Casimicrobiaceae bacterium]|nr:TorF family putative porin [Casimicrobiaceae bacterium]
MFRHAVVLWFALVAANVSAQVSGSLTLVSDYRFRGVSLSDNKPAAQLGVVYDDARGWYAGGFASTVQAPYPSRRELQTIAFLGYVWRLPSGLSSEVGADYSAFTGARRYGYPEVYWGIAYENLSGRLYYAPRYFTQDSDAIYGEVNGAQPLLDRVRLLAHAGVLRNSSDNLYTGRAVHHVFDARVGVGVDFDQFSAQLNWVGRSSTNAVYPVTGTGGRNAVVLSLFRSF